MQKTLRNVLFLTVAASLGACAGDAQVDNQDDGYLPPLANVDEILEGAPKADEIEPLDRKADETLPRQHTSILEWQSPVKSQGSRGVCSIFSTVGLMEHLYVKEGSLPNPDFSEQYLQWSAKFEVGSFPNTSGSNANYNLQAITNYGIVDEATYPYETSEWNEGNDERCNGEDDQPTVCYTNGHPSDEIQAAQKYTLPRGRWLRPSDIKTHMNQAETGVVVGLTFFYQGWNHRASDIPVNSESWAQGFVTYPNAKDEELSLAKRAGHSILLVGYDDDKEMPTLGEDGEAVVDENGDVVTEKGCFIFKNSWGTGGFGLESDWGPGYGCISYKYVLEYGRARISDLPDPVVTVNDEVCDDGVDNDGNGETDCDDSACTADPSCEAEPTNELTFEGEGDLSIPDNNSEGVGSTLTVTEEGTLTGLRVEVDISHTYRSDLRVSLHRGDEAVVLHANSGGGADDLDLNVDVADWVRTELAGDYRLVVVDSAGQDVGKVNSWRLVATGRVIRLYIQTTEARQELLPRSFVSA